MAILKGTESQPKEDVKVAKVTPINGGRISAVAAELMDTLIKKNADYAPTTEFSNFEKAAEFAGVSIRQAIAVQIGIKLTRIEGLSNGDHIPQYESLRDSYVDLAGYAVIAAAWLDSLGESDG